MSYSAQVTDVSHDGRVTNLDDLINHLNLTGFKEI